MRIVLWMLPIVFCACTRQEKSTATIAATDTTNYYKKHQLYLTCDSVVIGRFANDTISYTKQVFNRIIDLFPNLYAAFPDHPDITYVASGIYKEYTDEKGEKQTLSFGGEAGQDEFYMLYAYFLQKTKTGTAFNERREKLIRIYSNINSIYAFIDRGGTYFGHQQYRIHGYAEYSLYQYLVDSTRSLRIKNIEAQKTIYLKLLNQRIADELHADTDPITIDYKKERDRQLATSLKELNNLITDYFYLKQAMEFDHSNY